MPEVHRYKVVTMLSAAGATIGYDPHGPDVVMAHDLDGVTAERDALQQRLTAADERADVLTHLLREGLEEYKDGDDWIDRVIAALKPAEGGGDETRQEAVERHFGHFGDGE